MVRGYKKTTDGVMNIYFIPLAETVILTRLIYKFLNLKTYLKKHI